MEEKLQKIQKELTPAYEETWKAEIIDTMLNYIYDYGEIYKEVSDIELRDKLRNAYNDIMCNDELWDSISISVQMAINSNFERSEE